MLKTAGSKTKKLKKYAAFLVVITCHLLATPKSYASGSELFMLPTPSSNMHQNRQNNLPAPQENIPQPQNTIKAQQKDIAAPAQTNLSFNSTIPQPKLGAIKPLNKNLIPKPVFVAKPISIEQPIPEPIMAPKLISIPSPTSANISIPQPSSEKTANKKTKPKAKQDQNLPPPSNKIPLIPIPYYGHYLPSPSNTDLYHTFRECAPYFLTSTHELRWDQITGDAFYLNKQKINYLTKNGKKYIKPMPKSWLVVAIPGSRIVQLKFLRAQNNKENIQLFFANGTGLWQSIKDRIWLNKQTLLIGPVTAQASWIAIKYKTNFVYANPVSIYESRLQRTNRGASFQTDILPNDSKTRKNNLFWPISPFTPYRYWFTKNNSPYTFNIQGPITLEVNATIKLNSDNSDMLQTRWLDTYIDNHFVKSYNMSIRSINSNVYYTSNNPNIGTKQIQFYYHVPRGTHQVKITSMLPTYIRVTSAKYNFTASHINQKAITNTLNISNYHKNQLNNKEQKTLANITKRLVHQIWYEENTDKNIWPLYLIQKLAQSRPYNKVLQRLKLLTIKQNSYHITLWPKKLSIHNKVMVATPFLPSYQTARHPLGIRSLTQAYANTLINRKSETQYTKFGSEYLKTVDYEIPDYIIGPRILRLSLSSTRHRKMPVIIELTTDTGIKKKLYLTGQLEHHTLQRYWGIWQSAAFYMFGSALGSQHLPLMGYGSPLTLPIMECAYTKIILPENVHNIHLREISTSLIKPIWLNMQILSVKGHKLSEDEYINLLKRTNLQTRWLWFKDMIKLTQQAYINKSKIHFVVPRNMSSKQRLEYDIKNEWISIMYYLLSRRAELVYITGIKIQHKIEEEEKLAEKALAAEKDKKDLIALQYWSKLAAKSKGNSQFKAIYHLTNILTRLKEHHYLENMLRYYYLHAETEEVKEKVYKILIKIYEKNNEEGKIESFTATELFERPRQQILSKLIKLYYQRRDFRKLLKLLPLTQQEPKSAEILAICAYQKLWLKLIHYTLPALESEESRYKWLGKIAMSENQWKTAINDWQKAGKRGQELISQWQSGNLIKKELVAPHRAANTIISAWKEWGKYLSNDYSWKRASHLITQYAESVHIHSLNQKNYIAFLASTEKPITADIVGPTKIKIVGRPILTNQTKNPLATLNWTIDNIKHEWPIFTNTYSSTLSVFGNSSWRVGAKEEFVINIGPGLHHLKIGSTQLPVVIELSEYLPKNPKTVISVFSKPNLDALNWNKYSFLCYPKDVRQKTYILNRKKQYIHLQKTLNFDIIKKYCHINWNPFINAIIKPQKKVQDTTLLNNKKSQLIETMMNYVLDTLHSKKNKMQYISKAEMLYLKNPQMAEILLLWSEIANQVVWKRIDNINTGAGIFLQKHNAWVPEGERLKFASALSGLTKPHEQLIFSSGRLDLLINEKSQKDLYVKLDLKEPIFLRANNAKINYQLNNTPIQKITLTPQDPQHIIKIPIPKGKNVVKLWFAKLLRGQYIKTVMYQLDNSGNKNYLQPITYTEYHVIKPQHPAILYVTGPTVLRTEKKYGNHSTTRYLYIPTGKQKIIIHAENQQKTYLRAYQRTLIPAINYERRKSTIKDHRKLMLASQNKPLIKDDVLKYLYYPQWISPNDNKLPLGTQQSGTWELETGYITRFDQTDEVDTLERFGLLSATYNYYDSAKKLYYNAGALFRYPKLGKPVGGAYSTFFGKWTPTIETPPLTYWGRARFFTQYTPVTEKESKQGYDVDGLLAIGQLRSIASWLTQFPNVRLWGIYLNVNRIPTKLLNFVDQNVFTNFNSNHRYGIRFEDLFIFKPTWDTRFLLNLKLASNEDYNPFKPDNIGFSATFLQQFHNLMASISYNQNYYFRDPDRENESIIHRVYLNLNYFLWIQHQQLINFGFRAGWDPEVKDMLYAFRISFLLDNGRGLRDFIPSPRMRDLHQALIPKYCMIGEPISGQ